MKKEEKEKKKKKKLKLHFKLLLIIIIIIIYSFTLGTKGIFIKEYKVETNKLRSAEESIKVLHFSDLFYGSTINKNDLNKIINKINNTRPDVVIFTGDLLKKDYKLTEEEKSFMTKKFKKINAEIGKFYVTGENDFDSSNDILNMAEFINIKENIQKIFLSNNDYIYLLDKKADLSQIKEDNKFKLLITHNPMDIKDLSIKDYDMIIAGHTLNGSINIPKIKELFIDGKYTKTYQKINGTKLFINPGLGTNKVKARLFNHPTIYLYRIKKASK